MAEVLKRLTGSRVTGIVFDVLLAARELKAAIRASRRAATPQ